MKLKFLPLTICCLLPVVASAAYIPLVQNFNSGFVTTGSPPILHNQGGWTVNDFVTGNPNPLNNTEYLAYLVDPGSSDGNFYGALGGAWSAPNLANVELSHPISLTMDQSSIDLDLSLIESSAFPQRDHFGWTIRDSSNAELLRVALREYGQAGLRQIHYSVLGGALINTGADVVAGQEHHLSMDFTIAGADATYAFQFTGLNVFSGTLAGKAGAEIGSLVADFDSFTPGTPLNSGDNTMLFDNIVAVPEPSGMVLAGLSLGGLLLQRRRRQ